MTAPAAIKPFSIRIGAPCHAAFQEAVVHARNGYTFSDGPIELMPNGMAFFTMILGEADEHAIMKAKESVELSIQQAEAQYRRDIQEEAKRQIEASKRAELEKQVADAVAASEKAIAKLRKDAAAELAKLS